MPVSLAGDFSKLPGLRIDIYLVFIKKICIASCYDHMPEVHSPKGENGRWNLIAKTYQKL